MDENTPELWHRFHEIVRNERAAPELLLYQHEIISQVSEVLKAQEELVNALQAAGQDTLECDIMQMELQRHKYLLKDYYRTRLRKLEENILFYMDEVKVIGDQGNQVMQSDRLSQNEVAFAITFFQGWARHMNQTSVRYFPDEFQGLNSQRKSQPNKDLISLPDLDRHVFVRALEDLGNLAEGEELLEGVEQGTQWAVRYRLVLAAVRDNKAVLL